MAAAAADNAVLWEKVGEQTNSALAKALEEARKATDAARAEAFRAQEAAKAEAVRASEAAIRKVQIASTNAMKQLERAADTAKEQVSKVADTTLEASIAAQRAAEAASPRMPAGSSSPSIPTVPGVGGSSPAPGSANTGNGVGQPPPLRPVIPAPRPPPTPAELDDDPAPTKQEFMDFIKCFTLRPAALLPAAMAAHFAGMRGESGATVVRPLATGEYTWRIEGLTVERVRAYPPGKFLESPCFAVDNVQFFMRLYPAGDGKEESKGHVSAYLHIKTPEKKLTVDYEIAVLNQSNGLMFAREQAVKDMGLGSDGQPLPWAVASVGSSKFIAHTRLTSFREEVLRSSTMIITARLTTSATEPVQDFRQYIVVPPKALSNDLAALLASGEGSDVKFVVGDTSFRVHRIILSARSPVFRAMLQGPGKGTIAVEDVEPVVFQAVLRYLYTEDLEGEPGPELAQHLLVAADRFKIDRLRLLMEQQLCATLDVKSAAHVLLLADQHNATDLKRAASAFVALNAQAVMATSGWEQLCSSRPKLLSEVMRAMVPPGEEGGAKGAGGSGAGGAKKGGQ